MTAALSVHRILVGRSIRPYRINIVIRVIVRLLIPYAGIKSVNISD